MTDGRDSIRRPRKMKPPSCGRGHILLNFLSSQSVQDDCIVCRVHLHNVLDIATPIYIITCICLALLYQGYSLLEVLLWHVKY